MRPVILDIQDIVLTQEEREYLAHPFVAGVILFSRNYQSVEQLKELIRDIRSAVDRPLVIGVDHEGGRVQRFRDGFTTLPAAGSIIQHCRSLEHAKSLAQASAFVMASELIDCGVDISFAPVLDINGISDVIKERSFSDKPELVTDLAACYIQGMHKAGMASTGKHFPGHGSVKADSHIALPVDSRPENAILNSDMQPFARLIEKGMLDAIMPSHVVYDACDALPCGFSSYWLQTILRSRLNFEGVIISDDLSMHGASFIGNHLSRAESAINAGCDFILACNDIHSAISILDGLKLKENRGEDKLNRLLAKPVTQSEYANGSKFCVENRQLLTEFVEQV